MTRYVDRTSPKRRGGHAVALAIACAALVCAAPRQLCAGGDKRRNDRHCRGIGVPFAGPWPEPFAAILFVPYDEIAPPLDGFRPMPLLTTCVCEMRTVEPARAVVPCPLLGELRSENNASYVGSSER